MSGSRLSFIIKVCGVFFSQIIFNKLIARERIYVGDFILFCLNVYSIIYICVLGVDCVEQK